MADFDFGDILGGFGKLVDTGFNIYQGAKDRKQADRAYRENQIREDSAIQRRVADARLAGIHPIYALGAQGAASSPVQIGGSPDTGTSFGAAGQSFGRAMSAYKTPEEKEMLLANERLDLESKKISRDILEQRLAALVRINKQGETPGLPSGANNSPTLADPAGGTDPVKTEQEKRKSQIRYFGTTFPNDPYTSDAQEVEDVLGEGASDVLHPLAKVPSMMFYKGKLWAGAGAQEIQRRLNQRRSVPHPYRDVRRTKFVDDFGSMWRDYKYLKDRR